jgi:type II secretory pathway component GspD/PulD (secretin)
MNTLTDWLNTRGRPGFMRRLFAMCLLCTAVFLASAVTMAADDNSFNLSFFETDVRSVFTALGSAAGLNVVMEPAVQGTISIVLNDVILTDAIAQVAQQAGVLAIVTDQTLYVTVVNTTVPNSEVTITEGIISVRQLQYADTATVIELLKTIKPELKVNGDEKTQRIVALGSKQDIDEFNTFLELFDKPGPQVLIEARVEEVSHTALRRLGAQWSLPTISYTQDPLTAVSSITIEGLAAQLDALENQGEARLLARPQITTVSSEVAPIFVGDRIPVVLKGGPNKEDTITYIEAGIRLEIDARIAETGLITTKVDIEVSSIPSYTAEGLPVVRTRNAQTTVQVRDGQPIIIGGLIREEEQRSITRLPLIGELPVIGNLFRWNRSEFVQMETVIILTPYIVNNGTHTSATANATVPDTPPTPKVTADVKESKPLLVHGGLFYLAQTDTPSLYELAFGAGPHKNAWFELRAATLLSSPTSYVWSVGAACRAQNNRNYFETSFNYLLNKSLPYHWEQRIIIGVEVPIGVVVIEPHVGLHLAFVPGQVNSAAMAGIRLGWRN